MEFGPPKSEAGKRAVAPAGGGRRGVAPACVGVRRRRPGRVGVRRRQARRAPFRQLPARGEWAASVRKAGLPANFHFHDLRHVGNNLAAAAGASTRELMHRVGHASMRAALIYQHATSERDREIADGIDQRIAKAQGKKQATPPRKAAKRRRKGQDPDDGAAGVPARVS